MDKPWELYKILSRKRPLWGHITLADHNGNPIITDLDKNAAELLNLFFPDDDINSECLCHQEVKNFVAFKTMDSTPLHQQNHKNRNTHSLLLLKTLLLFTRLPPSSLHTVVPGSHSISSGRTLQRMSRAIIRPESLESWDPAYHT